VLAADSELYLRVRLARIRDRGSDEYADAVRVKTGEASPPPIISVPR
jgi:hypothetical protein